MTIGNTIRTIGIPIRVELIRVLGNKSTPDQNNSKIIMERYLFLDIDGVLNTLNYCDFLTECGDEYTDEDGAIFDPDAVENLAYIIKKIPNLKIVISSTWRHKGWDWMNRIWKKRKLPGEIYSFTPILDVVCFVDIVSEINSKSVYPYGTRGLEINEWIRLYACRDYQSYKYAIIDDEVDFLAIQGYNIVLTDPNVGITKEIAEKVIEKLL